MVETRLLHARFSSIPDRLQHESLPLVQARLVLFSIHDAGRWLCGKTSDPLEQGWTRHSRLQSFVVWADGVFGRLALDRYDRTDVGERNRDHAVLSSAHVCLHFS